jgi:acyl-CoA synthetase (AMP-forming)/AMP-acid ligase II
MRDDKPFFMTTPEEAARYRKSGAWPGETVYERFERVALAHLGKVAIIEESRQWTYRQVLDEVKALSRGLAASGIRGGDVVAAQLPNGARQPIVHLATNRIGALCMPIHESWVEGELTHLLATGVAVAAIVPASYRGTDYAALYERLKPTLPALKQVFTIGGGASSYEALLERDADDRMVAAITVDPDAPGDLMLSSGTTSMPKISMFSSNNLLALLQPFWRRIRIDENDVAAALAPAGTGAIGYVYPILTPLLNGATTVILEKWGEPEQAVELIKRHRCTYATGVPAQLTQMLPALKAAAPGDFAAFRCFANAGAPLPPEVGRQVEEAMGCKIFVIYGATDGGVATTTGLDDTQERRLGTVGRAQDECELRLVDDVGQPVAIGQTGEIHWRTADKSYGYLNDPEATAVAFTKDRFYRTGDLGVLDEEGYLRIVGRVKDMIIRGGRNISPRLIEEMVMRHPAVLEAAVAGYPDPVLGERACAFAVLRKGESELGFKALIEFLRGEHMPTWQMPERLEVMAELPRSAGGKVMKNKLRDFIAGKVKAEAEALAGAAATATSAANSTADHSAVTQLS